MSKNKNKIDEVKFAEWKESRAAQARIRAAAPALLAALEGMLALEQDYRGTVYVSVAAEVKEKEARKVARAAIAEARGTDR